MFADATTPAERLERFEAYKATLGQCIEKSQREFANGETMFVKEQGIVKSGTTKTRLADLEGEIKDITKGMADDQAALMSLAIDGDETGAKSGNRIGFLRSFDVKFHSYGFGVTIA